MKSGRGTDILRVLADSYTRGIWNGLTAPTRERPPRRGRDRVPMDSGVAPWSRVRTRRWRRSMPLPLREPWPGLNRPRGPRRLVQTRTTAVPLQPRARAATCMPERMGTYTRTPVTGGRSTMMAAGVLWTNPLRAPANSSRRKAPEPARNNKRRAQPQRPARNNKRPARSSGPRVPGLAHPPPAHNSDPRLTPGPQGRAAILRV